MPQVLEPAELAQALSDLPGVTQPDAASLAIRAQLPSFLAAVQLISDVAPIAEEMDHHPDADLRWRTVTFTLSTHSEGGVTSLDVTLARRILELAAQAGAQIKP
jgi:4a-hydroxytetrahydrobiopterin dehydratase